MRRARVKAQGSQGIEHLFVGLSSAAAPRPFPHTPRARRGLQEIPPILDCSRKESRSKRFSSLFFSLIQNPKSKIQNYLMTLSARASTLGGIVRPICFAVLKM